MTLLASEAMIAAALAAADASGGVLRQYFRGTLNPVSKDDDSPVTHADHEAELAMRRSLSLDFPTHGIYGEEEGLSRPESPFRWILDPIDGTRAFITGRPSFVTLISLMHEGEPLIGIIDQPVTGERWLGVKGQPTRYTGPFPGKAGCRPCPSLQNAEISCTAPEILAPFTQDWQRLAAKCARVSWGGDGYAYGLLALGHIDIIAEAGLKIWDWAALVPIIEGAGGTIGDWQGRPLYGGGDGRVLAVGDPALRQTAVSVLN
jgi:myo-inositol-1(or 4)-monophosphatase